MDRDSLLERLTVLDFMAVDLALFLNTHPNNKEAIAQYNKIIEAANTVRNKYEELYGPLCSFRSMSLNPDRWTWDSNPWPWETDFNFVLSNK